MLVFRRLLIREKKKITHSKSTCQSISLRLYQLPGPHFCRATEGGPGGRQQLVRGVTGEEPETSQWPVSTPVLSLPPRAVGKPRRRPEGRHQLCLQLFATQIPSPEQMRSESRLPRHTEMQGIPRELSPDSVHPWFPHCVASGKLPSVYTTPSATPTSPGWDHVHPTCIIQLVSKATTSVTLPSGRSTATLSFSGPPRPCSSGLSKPHKPPGPSQGARRLLSS